MPPPVETVSQICLWLYTLIYRALTPCTRVDSRACALDGSLCETEVRHSNAHGWLPVILPEHTAIGSPTNLNIQEGGPLYCLVSIVNLILWWMLFRWYKECCSFSGSRDHRAKPAGGLLIAWSSTFFSNPPHRSPLPAEKVESCNTIITASLCSQKWSPTLKQEQSHDDLLAIMIQEVQDLLLSTPVMSEPEQNLVQDPQILHTRYWGVYEISRFLHVGSE